MQTAYPRRDPNYLTFVVPSSMALKWEKLCVNIIRSGSLFVVYQYGVNEKVTGIECFAVSVHCFCLGRAVNLQIS